MKTRFPFVYDVEFDRSDGHTRMIKYVESAEVEIREMSDGDVPVVADFSLAGQYTTVLIRHGEDGFFFTADSPRGAAGLPYPVARLLSLEEKPYIDGIPGAMEVLFDQMDMPTHSSSRQPMIQWFADPAFEQNGQPVRSDFRGWRERGRERALSAMREFIAKLAVIDGDLFCRCAEPMIGLVGGNAVNYFGVSIDPGTYTDLAVLKGQSPDGFGLYTTLFNLRDMDFVDRYIKVLGAGGLYNRGGLGHLSVHAPELFTFDRRADALRRSIPFLADATQGRVGGMPAQQAGRWVDLRSSAGRLDGRPSEAEIDRVADLYYAVLSDIGPSEALRAFDLEALGVVPVRKGPPAPHDLSLKP